MLQSIVFFVKRFFHIVYVIMVIFGVDLVRTLQSIRGLFFYFHDRSILKKQQKKSTIKYFFFGKPFPCLGDRFVEGGTAKGDYFHQDLLVAQRIFANNPKLHLDIGSRIDGFVAHVAAFRHIRVIDIRPILSKVANIEFIQADLMQEFNPNFLECCDSLSCLHALEHFGLGRYGDPIRYDGYLIGLDNLYKLLQPNGKFYFSVPIGPQRIEFNAHRVFSIGYLLELFKGKYQIDAFSYVDDCGDLHKNSILSDELIAKNAGCQYGCGIFEMTKL